MSACCCRRPSRVGLEGSGHVKAEARSIEPPVCSLPTAITARYSISISSKQGCLSPDPWKAVPIDRLPARDRRPDVPVRIRRSMSSHLSGKPKHIEKRRTGTRDEKVRSFHAPTFDGEDAVFSAVTALLQRWVSDILRPFRNTRQAINIDNSYSKNR